MRFIRRQGKPPKKLIEAAEEVTKQLEAATTRKERKQIIDDNRKVYRAFHDWLMTQSHDKCWFSDTDASFCHFDVEHYRPKTESKDLDGNKREGYWWLAFDWTNLRICGNVGNRKKGTFFPLRDEDTAATAAKRSTREERPMLLDPARQADASVVDFNMLGKVVPSPEATKWDRDRIKVSVERYKLDFDRLEERRKKIWDRCQKLINQCQNEMKELDDTDSAIGEDSLNKCFERLRELIDPREPLSCVAVSCLLASGLRWAAKIATAETPTAAPAEDPD